MLKKILPKAMSTAIIIAVLIALSLVLFGAQRALPQNPMNGFEELLPDVIFSTKGENKFSGQNGNSETDSETKNTETTTDKNDDTEKTPEGIPEIEAENLSENQKPNIDNHTDSEGGDSAGEGGGDVSGDEAEGDPVVVTDLENKIVTTTESPNGDFSFFAYIENGGSDYSLEINFVNDKTSSSGENLSASDDYYDVNLSLGSNIFTIYLLEKGSIVSSAKYVITYQAEKADASNPVVGEGISVVTNLDGFDGVLENKYFTFTVTARSNGKTIYSDHIEVTLDGVTVDDPTGSSTFEYVLNFSDEESHIVTVLAWDDDGNSMYCEYEVKFKGVAEGESMGMATVVIDATTAGLGIIGSIDIDITQGETAAETLIRALEEMGLDINYSGSATSGFYVSGIGGFSGTPQVPDELWELVLRDGLSLTSPPSGSMLSAADFTVNSGWMYSVNGVLYPGKGLSAYNLSEGDVLYLRFTIADGKDIGGSGSGNGNLSGYCGVWTDGGYYEENHDYYEVDRTEPTATEYGYIHYICSNCEHEYEEEIPPTCEEEHEHDYYEIGRTEPTETEDGYIEFECSCGDYYTETLPATGIPEDEDTVEDENENEEGGEEE